MGVTVIRGFSLANCSSMPSNRPEYCSSWLCHHSMVMGSVMA